MGLMVIAEGEPIAVLALLAVASLLALGWHLWRQRHRAWHDEHRLRPRALRDAELVYVEDTFTTAHPIPMVAKLDRAYRLPSGVLVLVELKTRWTGRPTWSDVVQLSAQRLALAGSTKQPVADEAFVVIVPAGGGGQPTVHRVPLLKADEVVAVAKRRAAVLAGRVKPRYAFDVGHCRNCPFSGKCVGALASERP